MDFVVNTTPGISVSDIYRAALLDRHPNVDLIYSHHTIFSELSTLDLAEEIREALVGELNLTLIFRTYHQTTSVLMEGTKFPISIGVYGESMLEPSTTRRSTVYITTTPDVMRFISALIKTKYTAPKQIEFVWYYMSGGRMTTKAMTSFECPEQHDEFYPFIPEGHFDRYMASPASILFMKGPPGTGKTSYLRRAAFDRSLGLTIGYDEKLFESDEMVMTWMNSSDSILVIEDADVLLSSREREANKAIARFLNVADGLIRMPQKKIVFTTNLHDFSSVDPALLRPGRCFDAIEFRPLTYQEAVAATQAAGLPAPVEVRDYTAAELYNLDRPQIRQRRVGFM
jgi:hypothetical protein